ncbi:MAG TPA: (2Fe-2S)-binding protein, partial [Anaerolineae bacterium]|nr:(2Fe-2S)-binding protein [Anaerolineae bacterium]
MPTKQVEIHITINGEERTLSVKPEESLMAALRGASYFSVKSGCDDGTCGVCTVLLGGKPIRSCQTKAADADGAAITTLEGLSREGALHPLQEAYMETGAIQCGYCTPGLILCAKALLDRNSDPSEDEIRRALTRVLCRCTGYVRSVDAVQRAAAALRGEKPAPFTHLEQALPEDVKQIELPEGFYRRDGGRNPLPPLVLTPA